MVMKIIKPMIFFDVSKCSVTYICYQSYIFDFEYKESKFSITQKNDFI